MTDQAIDALLTPTRVHAVNKLCQPIFQHSDLCFFYYARLFQDGSCYALTTHDQWARNRVQQDYPFVLPFSKYRSIEKFYWYEPADSERAQTIFTDFREHFDLAYPLYLGSKQEDYYDLFCYATGASLTENEAINFYLNNTDILEKFASFFAKSGQSLINDVQSDRIRLPEKSIIYT